MSVTMSWMGYRRWPKPKSQQLHRGSKTRSRVVEFDGREADLGGTKLGPRMGVGILGLLRIPLLLGSALLLSIGFSLLRLTPGQLSARAIRWSAERNVALTLFAPYPVLNEVKGG